MKWSEEVWAKSLKIFNGILEQPFIKELAAGTLPVEKFSRYLAQDEVYIGNYGRQMYELADLMKDPAEHDFFVAYADSGIESEKYMHQLLIDRYNIDTEVVGSSVTKAYNGHTQTGVDTGRREVALAAMLPCAWIYNRVGLEILKIARMEGNPYREWIEEYGNEEFTVGTNALVDIADKWAETVDPGTRDLMTEYYLQGALYEYAFWDYGYNGDTGDYAYMQRLEEWI